MQKLQRSVARTPISLRRTDWMRKMKSGVHSTTAEDLAKIMRYCIMTSTEKETFLEVTRTKEYQFQDTEKKRYIFLS